MEPTLRIRYAIAMGLFALVLIMAGYFITHPKTPVAHAPTTEVATTTVSATTTAAKPVTNPSISIPQSADATAMGLVVPNLNRPYTPPSYAPADVQASDKATVAAAIKQLKIDPNHLAYWLQLAVYRKQASDFVGAEEILLYCVARWPKDETAFGNLVDIYGNYTHQYDKAILYSKKRIALKPGQIPAYINLAMLYNVNLHDPANAKATLQEGLANNPNNPDLARALSALQ